MNRKLPKYCHHKATGRAFVILTLADRTRKTVYLGPYNSEQSLLEYDKVVGQWLATKEAPIPESPDPSWYSSLT
jgi:hypothetical protein